MKATLTYQCDEPGHEQTLTITAAINCDKPSGTVDMTMEFDPECSDDTSDPTGLLNVAIDAFTSFVNRHTAPPPAGDTDGQ